MQKKRWPHTHWDASAFYSLRQHLLCVIAPSPTRFTPYILSSLHLPHLHLPLYRPLPPSRSFFFLSFPPTIFYLFPPAVLPVFIPPSNPLTLSPLPRQLAWGAVEQISLTLPCFSSHCSPRDDGFPVAVLLSSKTGALHNPPVAACVPLVLLAAYEC